jgi:hypothetical protein
MENAARAVFVRPLSSTSSSGCTAVHRTLFHQDQLGLRLTSRTLNARAGVYAICGSSRVRQEVQAVRRRSTRDREFLASKAYVSFAVIRSRVGETRPSEQQLAEERNISAAVQQRAYVEGVGKKSERGIFVGIWWLTSVQNPGSSSKGEDGMKQQRHSTAQHSPTEQPHSSKCRFTRFRLSRRRVVHN